MARNVQRRNDTRDPAAEGQFADATQAPLPGGTLGSPELLNKPETHIAMPGHQIVGDASRRQEQRDAPPARCYRLMDGPRDAGTGKVKIMYERCPVLMPLGKELGENAYDLELLHRQGCVMVAIDNGERYKPPSKEPVPPPDLEPTQAVVE